MLRKIIFFHICKSLFILSIKSSTSSSYFKQDLSEHLEDIHILNFTNSIENVMISQKTSTECFVKIYILRFYEFKQVIMGIKSVFLSFEQCSTEENNNFTMVFSKIYLTGLVVNAPFICKWFLFLFTSVV